MYGRRRRFKRKNKVASNFVTATYTEMYDLTTKKDAVTFLGIHTPNSNRPVQCMEGFFKQYQQFRVASTDIYLIPGANLPIDPLQASMEGENNYDIKDELNPIIHFGMPGGQNLGAYVDFLFKKFSVQKDTIDQADIPVDDLAFPTKNKAFENLYYQMLISQGVKKSDSSRGFIKKGCYPLVNQLATALPHFPYFDSVNQRNMIDFAEGSIPSSNKNENPQFVKRDDASVGTTSVNKYKNVYDYKETIFDVEEPVYHSRGYYHDSIFTSKKQRMGWIDTITVNSPVEHDLVKETDGEDGLIEQFTETGGPVYAQYPKLFMYGIILPPCYKMTKYFRLIVKHKFQFRGFHNSIGLWNKDLDIDYTPMHTDTDLVTAVKDSSVEAFEDSAEVTKVMDSVQ